MRVVKAPDVRRGELIGHARQLFFEQGYDNTAVADIVAAAGVAKGTFYYYFDSKLAVLEALVEELLDQSQALMHAIVTDPALPALDKWHDALQVVADWKTDRKAELLALMALMEQKENLVLRHHLQSRATAVLAPELAHIIAQGVDEGVFDTEHVDEAAEIVLAVLRTFRDTLGDIVLHPERHTTPSATARRKIAAVQTAVERVLGAAPGALPLVDAETIDAWFAPDPTATPAARSPQ